MVPRINTTRGVPFEPRSARRLRVIEGQIKALRHEQHGARPGSMAHRVATEGLLHAQNERRRLRAA